ncbi:GyrI-like domain-containing protein [Candidatus Enterococcus clewellii]|uniref:AraC effector-binding domain-containing protein n=1 Tax=Candidatus Enterococcus clewellii TaxID=1834193 RepID=A0A242K647_9ENTE|nr:effector binding domain-containing protein [Enterococcus sp. 9E7_DIV0242]OTP15780.1 hypothetical protein A5888_001994 [Enterococcus sp. 9E7_DIV0242]
MNVYEIGSIRTNNFTADMGEKIGGLWQQVMPDIQGIAPIYAIYHEYESNYTGDYTLSLAVEPAKSENILELDEGQYRIFPVEQTPEDPSRNNVAETWQKIWQLEESGSLNRRYEKDYEKYAADGTVAIHIGIN